MKDAQSGLEVVLDSIANGDRAPKPKRKWRRLERKIEALKVDYQGGQRSLEDYWKAICHCVKNYV
jgi:hypothetical protein